MSETSLQAVNRFYDEQYASAKCAEHQFDIETARAILFGYMAYYDNDGYKCAAIEEVFCLPIYDLINKKKTDQHYSGVIDSMLYDRDGELWLSDHKTVGANQLFGDAYWEQLQTNPQLTQYTLAFRQLGIKVAGFLWDVIKKPTISPKKLTKANIKEIEEHGTYCGHVYLEWRGEESETPKMFGIRLLDSIYEKPEDYFIRRCVRRTDQELMRYGSELYELSQRAKSFPDNPNKVVRNLNQCKAFNRLCEYHDLCAGYCDKTNVDFKYQAIPKNPGKDENSLIVSGSFSPSRLSTLQLCEQKYYYKYVLKIEKRKKEYETALELGTLVHSGLEIWLSHRMCDESRRLSLDSLCRKQLSE